MTRSVSMLALAGTALLAGCNDYDDLRLTGYQQESFSSKADILFVVDNTSSMREDATRLAENFAEFAQMFAPAGGSTGPTDVDLKDDLQRYLKYLIDPQGNLNFHLGLTTTDPERSWGSLIGNPLYLTPSDGNVGRTFEKFLLCGAVCGADAGGDCPAGMGGSTCSSSGIEEPLEAVFMAMCRSVEEPPEACFQDWWQNFEAGVAAFTAFPPEDDPERMPEVYFSEADVASNGNFIREGSTVIPVLITGEGDNSRRITNKEGDYFPYNDLFSQFDNRMAWAVIGPNPECNPGEAPFQINRLRRIVYDTNGAYINLEEPDSRGRCDASDFSENLARVGDLLRSLGDTFPLEALPIPETILVEVNGVNVERAAQEYDESLQLVVYSDGWSYDSSTNTVVLHGDAVPDFDSDIRVRYLPASGAPRPLPF